jgi:acyl-CoA synthetase (AMP-forming)/AMP-acid ligase II
VIVLLSDLLRDAAKKHPDKPAAIFPDDRISFAELDRKSSQVAARLSRQGIGPGDRVALIFENAPAALVYFWGVLKSGAQNVDIPSQAGEETILGVLEEAKPKALAIQARPLQKLLQKVEPARLPKMLFSTKDATSIAAEHKLELMTLEEILESERPEEQRPSVSEHDVAMIVYTSGTTGRPKGVMLSHDNLYSNISSANALVGLSEKDSILVVVPFYFIHGRMQILTHAMIAGTIVVSAGFQFPTVVLEEIQKHEVSGFSGVPYHFMTLMEKTKLKTASLPKLKYVLITGGAMSTSALQELHAAMPGVDVHTAYGQTEASPRITYLGPQEMFEKLGCAGRPLPGVKVEIVDDNGIALVQGQIGEVVASGPNIMKGYVSGDEVSSGRIDRLGRLKTGDLGRIDESGYLWLRGRSSEMIKTAGERVFPKEIEDQINAHPSVAESAVVGVKDETLGERIVALVVVKSGQSLTLAELRTHCLRSMPFVRVPREMKVVDKLPKTASGKLNRGQLASLL